MPTDLIAYYRKRKKEKEAELAQLEAERAQPLTGSRTSDSADAEELKARLRADIEEYDLLARRLQAGWF